MRQIADAVNKPKAAAPAVDFYARYRGLLEGPGAKYLRLRSMLDAALEAGYWGEDGRLPTEHELARVTGLSLGTIQRALRELVDEGRLVRTAGRGTFVARAKVRLDEPFVSARFLNDDGTGYLPIRAQLVSRGLVSGPGGWVESLRPAGEAVFRVERLFEIDGEFCILNRFYVDPARFPAFADLGAREFRSTNLRGLLARMYGFSAVSLRQTLRFQRFPAEVCRLLRCRAGTTGLLQSVTASMHGSDAVYYVELFIPPNRRAMLLPEATLGR